MDILSALPFILFIFLAAANKINKRTTSTKQQPPGPSPQSFPWARDLETSLQKWLLDEDHIPEPKMTESQKHHQFEETAMMANIPETEGTDGVEGTAGTEGSAGTEGTAATEGNLRPTLSSEIETPRLAENSFLPALEQKNLAEAVIWAEILGKPKARIARPYGGFLTTK